MIHRIVYMSRAASSFSDLDIDDLAEQASLRNAATGITGLLVFDGRRFLQAIEGDETAVRELMHRIACDERHDMIEIMADGPAKRRKFGTWSMACRRVADHWCTDDFLKQIKERVVTIPNVELQAAFIGFARLAYDGSGKSGRRLLAG